MARKKKILIVEDEKPIVEYIEALLGLSGYETIVAMDGRRAIDTARESFPDLILLDVMLPKLNGFDVCKIIRQDPALAKTPVVMLTSLNQVGDIDKAYEVGATDYITKPFDSNKLIPKIKKNLGEE